MKVDYIETGMPTKTFFFLETWLAAHVLIDSKVLINPCLLPVTVKIVFKSFTDTQGQTLTKWLGREDGERGMTEIGNNRD